MAGSVKFNADTAGAVKEISKLDAATKAVNAELKTSEKVAKKAYEQQRLGAVAAGASTEELRRIQQRWAQEQLAISNTRSQATRDWIKGNIETLSTEEAKVAVLDLVKQKLAEEAAAVRALGTEYERASVESVSGVQATSAAIRGLEGSGGIRAVENFLSKTLGLGPAMQAIFPLVGGAMFADMLVHIGEKVYDVEQKAAHAAEAIHQAQSDAHAGAQITIDDLNIQADKLQQNIDKLEGRPNNGLALALDEARKFADELSKSLGEDRKQLEALLKEHSVSAFGSALSGVAGTGEQAKQLIDDRKKFDSGVDSISANYWHSVANAKDQNDVKKAEDTRNQQIRSFFGSQIATYKAERARLAKEQSDSDAMAQATEAQYGVEGYHVDNSAKIANIDYALDQYQRRLDEYTGGVNVSSLTQKEGSLKSSKDQDHTAGQEARKAAEAARKAAEEQRKQWEDDYAAFESVGNRTLDQEIQFWINRANEAQRGSENYAEASKKADELIKRRNEQQAKLLDEKLKLNTQLSAEERKGVLAAILPGIEAQGKGAGDAARTANELQDAQKAAGFQLAQASIQYQLSAGRISKYDAAVQEQTLHTQEYSSALADLKEKLAALREGPEADAQRNAINTEILKLDTSRAIQQMQDAAKVSGETWSGALNKANADWVENAQDSAKQVIGIYQSALGGFNGDISHYLMSISRSNYHSGRDFRNALSGTAKGIGGQVVNAGLQHAESGILGKFGLAKADGSKGSPLHVIVENQPTGGSSSGGSATSGLTSLFGDTSGDGSSASSGSGIFSSVVSSALSFVPGGSLFSGLFGGGKASGGDVYAGMKYTVGENGPETLTMGSRSGYITPSRGSSSGGGTAYYAINIPSGVTPEYLHQTVASALAAAHPKVVASSVQAMRQAQLRMPRSSGR